MELVSQLKLAIVPRIGMSTKILYYLIKTFLGGVVLKTILLWSHEVATLVLSDSDVPFPGGGGGGGVDVQRDGHTGVTGRYPHVLASVVATNCWWRSVARNTDFKFYRYYHRCTTYYYNK